MVILFGLNLVFGYLAMLVAMTYSIELFICVVLGLCVGHFTFNTQNVVGKLSFIDRLHSKFFHEISNKLIQKASEHCAILL